MTAYTRMGGKADSVLYSELSGFLLGVSVCLFSLLLIAADSMTERTFGGIHRASEAVPILKCQRSWWLFRLNTLEFQYFLSGVWGFFRSINNLKPLVNTSEVKIELTQEDICTTRVWQNLECFLLQTGWLTHSPNHSAQVSFLCHLPSHLALAGEISYLESE